MLGLYWVLLDFAGLVFFGSFCVLLFLGASEALWCLLWVSLAYPCFRWRTLAFSCVVSFARQWFACCLFFLLLYLASHTSTAVNRFRSYCCMLPLLSYVFALPVHLLRQVFKLSRLNKEISLLRVQWRGKQNFVIRRYVEMQGENQFWIVLTRKFLVKGLQNRLNKEFLVKD